MRLISLFNQEINTHAGTWFVHKPVIIVLQRHVFAFFFNSRQQKFSFLILNHFILFSQKDQVKTPFYKFTCCEIDFDLLQERFLAIEGNPAHCISDEKVCELVNAVIELLKVNHVGMSPYYCTHNVSL